MELYKITEVPPRERAAYAKRTIARLTRRISAQRAANRRGRADIKSGRKHADHANWIGYKTRHLEQYKARKAGLEKWAAGACSWDAMIRRLGLMECARCGAENRAYIWTADFITSGYYCQDCHADGMRQLEAWRAAHGGPADGPEKVDALSAGGFTRVGMLERRLLSPGAPQISSNQLARGGEC